MSNSAKGRERLANEQLERFKARPDVEAVAKKYGGYSDTPEGKTLNLILCILATTNVTGVLTGPHYNQALAGLASAFEVPFADLTVMAECHVEILKCGLSSGQKGPSFATNQPRNRRW